MGEPIDLEPYREALREKICGVCLDRKHDGTCGRPTEQPCALDSHLDSLVQIVVSMGDRPGVDDYVDALRAGLCPVCNQDEDGHCARREIVHCALDSYVIPVVDVILAVAEREGDRPPESP